MENRSTDILIFGATGFTGMHCISYIQKLSKENDRNMKWGVSGRSEEKLKQVLEKVGKELDVDLSQVPTVVADIHNHESLLEMAKQTKLIINCCGPFKFLGDNVVKACIEAGTHHIDVSGEPEYMETIQLEHHEKAMEKGIYIISACGFDSIPSDLGVIFLQDKFDGTLNSVETYLSASMEGNSSGPWINYGTWISAVESMAGRENLKEIRKKLFTKRIPKYQPQLKQRFLPFTTDKVDGWVLPFMGSDKSVIRRTQQYIYEAENKRALQIATYFTVSSTFALVMTLIYGIIFGILTKFAFGRRLLMDYPSLFSGGTFSKDLPSEETIQNTKFTITLYGEGWKDKLTDKDDQYDRSCDRCILAAVKGSNPAYGATCLTLVLAGILVLSETKKLAGNGKGGVYPPGAAFAKTSMVEECNKNGLTFDIDFQKDL